MANIPPQAHLRSRPNLKVSILIASRNRVESLYTCLDTVFNQAYDPLEVLVLDDNSNLYRLDELVKVKFSRTHACAASEPIVQWGLPAAANFLMERATGDILCFIDDDACFIDKKLDILYRQELSALPFSWHLGLQRSSIFRPGEKSYACHLANGG